METKHLLTENSDWTTKAEFAYPQGKIVSCDGEIHIKVYPDHIEREFWFNYQSGRLDCLFTVKPITFNSFTYESNNIKNLGKEEGTVQINRDRLYSKFVIVNTLMNGFEITIFKDNICYIDGALYHDHMLIMTWSGIAEKI